MESLPSLFERLNSGKKKRKKSEVKFFISWFFTFVHSGKIIPLNTVYLHLGSNKNEPLKQILNAFKRIETEIGSIEDVSSFYKTEAWGNKEQADFINVALKVSSQLEVEELMLTILKIEENMGRIRTKKWVARIIDIDVIFYNALSYRSDLIQVPHPLLQKRKFVLMPLIDIAAAFIHPVLHKSILALSEDCEDTSKVILL